MKKQEEATMVQIDGSYGEGGGQIIRNSLALAAVTGKSVEIKNIRARRSKPGLQPQHLTAVRAAASICAARLEGDAVGTNRLLFEPQAAVQPGEYRFDIGTAGATGLVLQTLLLPLSHLDEGSRVRVIGGTHVPHAPTIDYLQEVYLPALQRAHLGGTVHYTSAGFYPRGGGDVYARINGTPSPTPIVMQERGNLVALKGVIVTSNLAEHVADRGAATIEQFMKGIGRKIAVERHELPSPGMGASVLIAAECEGGFAGFTGIGERGKPMEKVAQDPCEAFLRWWKTGAACDEHLADQMVLPAALASGESLWTTPEVTEHLRTALYIAQHFVPIESAIEEKEGMAVVRVRREA
jgi:RNA 3'-terminal phosphate cyclase (ATP)